MNQELYKEAVVHGAHVVGEKARDVSQSALAAVREAVIKNTVQEPEPDPLDSWAAEIEAREAARVPAKEPVYFERAPDLECEDVPEVYRYLGGMPTIEQRYQRQLGHFVRQIVDRIS